MKISKKIFRMKYEPCLGTCYAYEDELMKQFKYLSNDKIEFNKFLNNLVYIHDATCGNLNVGFRLDVDEDTFIGTFEYYNKSQTFISTTISGIFDKFKYYLDLFKNTSEGTRLKKDINKEVCDHGRDNDIVTFTLKAANISSEVLL